MIDIPLDNFTCLMKNFGDYEIKKNGGKIEKPLGGKLGAKMAASVLGRR